MEVVAGTALRRWPEPWYRRSVTWIGVAVIAFGLAAFSWVSDSPVAALVFLGVGGISLAGGILLIMRGLRAARAEMAAIIDTALAAREADPHLDTDEDVRKRAAIIAFRQHLSRAAPPRTG